MRTVNRIQTKSVQSLLLVSLLLTTGNAWGQVSGGTKSPSSGVSAERSDTQGSTSPSASTKDQTAVQKRTEENLGQSGDKNNTEGEAGTNPTQSTDSAEADKQEIENLKRQMAEMEADFNARLEDLELKGLDEGSVVEEMDRKFRVYGFFDLAFMWKDVKDGSYFNEGDGFVNTSPQFLMQHLNLYFSSDLTKSLSFLTEVQFTFLPNGGTTATFNDQERIDTTVVDPYTQQQYQWGSILIQRAWLKWEPFQFFGVKAGYFLTPYGIWHEDHASTARISILPPFENDTVTPPQVIGKKPIPNAQLGLQVFGRLFPSENLRLDYALTLSNGRGPADTVVDYDDNKGLGLRLRLTYSNPNVEVALGGYGYFGEYTDKYFSYWNEQLLENYKEYALATDFLISFFGVRLQAEYLRNLTRYSDAGRPESPFGMSEIFLVPDYVANIFYTLLAYQLPLSKWLRNHTLTPYVGFEFDKPKDDMDYYKIFITNFGLNYKPSSFVVLKVEGSRFFLKFIETVPDTVVWTVAGQLAVSF